MSEDFCAQAQFMFIEIIEPIAEDVPGVAVGDDPRNRTVCVMSKGESVSIPYDRVPQLIAALQRAAA